MERKIEKKYILDGDVYELEKVAKSFRIYVSEHNNVAHVTDLDDNILATITADSSQNSGFLNVE